MPSLLLPQQEVIGFEFFVLWMSQTVLRVVGIGFAMRYRPYEEIRFVSSKKRK